MIAKVESMMASFDISRDSVMAIVTDTEPTMTAFGREIGLPWLGCFDHILELNTGIPFENDKTKAVLKVAREVIGQFLGSTQAAEKLEAMQKMVQPESNPVGVVQDVATRWWSTWKALNRINYLRPSVDALHSAKQIRIAPNPEQWDVMGTLELLLSPFMECQKFMEGDKYVTIISFLPFLVHLLRGIIDDMISSYSSERISACSEAVRIPVHACAVAMKAKFVERWGSGEPGTVFDEHKTEGVRRIQKGLPLIAMLAAALDPRTKSLKGIPVKDQLSIYDVLTNKMHEKYDQLHKLPDLLDAVSVTSSAALDDMSDGVIDLSSFHDEEGDEEPDLFETLQDVAAPTTAGLSYEERRFQVVNQELSFFKREQPLPHKMSKPGNPLLWYQTYELRYPLLSKLALEYLCIPVTSASSERVFSAAGNTISDHRARLTPEHASDLVVLKGSWSKVDDYKSKCKKRSIE
jgi:hypothetical protein